jgi:hypothetical protein
LHAQNIKKKHENTKLSEILKPFQTYK